ncbi:MAG: hypothetical protein HQL41_15910 [Alphaproteobacteria bacterium]|nr:hypothetical protein [Alphaproteobacteria bacterium]
MTARYKESVVGTADDGYGDAGDTRRRARLVRMPDSVVGSVGHGSDDADWYYVQFTQKGTATFTLSGMTADLDLSVHSSFEKRPIEVSANDDTAAESVSYTAWGGFCYVRVAPFEAAASDYTLTTSLVIDDRGWGDEHGNSFATATAITLPHTTSSECGVFDDDYMRFTAAGGGTLTANLTGLASSAEVDLRLYDDTGALLASSSNAGNSAESISHGVTAGEAYVLQVDSVQGYSSFTLTASIA